ncbi:hypothetical protein [Streptomyces sp. NPDC101455]|uniref:hypothetical protein n=1 Tax=Streptomyces sp. NPDC101455 TaxID=3366142 RepID=UPI0037F80DF9
MTSDGRTVTQLRVPDKTNEMTLEEVIGKTVWAEVPLESVASDAPAPRPPETGPELCRRSGPQ